jgi:hypothetical protein
MQTDSRNRNSQGLGLVLIGLGAIFLIGQVFRFNVFNMFGAIAWPLYVIVPGVALLAAGVATGKNGLPLTIIGSIATGTGLILGYQSVFNQYQTWAYAWTLYPVFVGGGLILHGMFTEQPTLVQRGLRSVRIGAILFAVFWVFFEMFIGLSGSGFSGIGRTVGPLLLIVLGGYLLFVRRNQLKD